MTGAVARRPRPLPCRARKDTQDGGTGAPATLPRTGRAPRWGHGPGPPRRLASTGSTNLTVPGEGAVLNEEETVGLANTITTLERLAGEATLTQIG